MDLKKLWNKLDGNKTSVGIVLVCIATIVQQFGVEIPAEVWTAIALFTGVGIGHKGVKAVAARKT